LHRLSRGQSSAAPAAADRVSREHSKLHAVPSRTSWTNRAPDRYGSRHARTDWFATNGKILQGRTYPSGANQKLVGANEPRRSFRSKTSGRRTSTELRHLPPDERSTSRVVWD